MGDDQAVNIVLTVEGAEQSAAAVGSVEQRMSSLEQAFIRFQGAADTTTVAHVKHTEAATGLGAALQVLDSHVRTVSMGFQAAGLDADAAAVKISALTQVVEGAEKAFAPLLLGLAAIAAAFIAFNATKDFLSESVKAAATLEQQMRRLQTAVRDQGGAWSEAREEIEGFVQAEGRLTGMAHDKLRESMTMVVNAGHDVSDAMKIVAIAEDVATARGMDLVEVTDRMMHVEGARALGLLELDPRLKDLIKSHADLDTIMTKLAQDTRDQAISATSDFDVAVGRLTNAWDDFKEDVGSWLLPWLTDVLHTIEDLVDSTHEWIKSLAGAHNIAPVSGSPAAVGAFGSLDEYAGIGALAAQGVMGAHDAADASHAKSVAAAKARHTQNAHNVHLHRNFNVGMGGQEGAGFSPSIERPDRTTDPTAIDDMVKMVDAYKKSEAELEHQMKMTGSAAEYEAAQTAILATRVSDAKSEVEKLTPVVAANHAAFVDAKSTLDEAIASDKTYQETLTGKTKKTQDDEAAIKAHKKAIEDARIALADATTTLKLHNDLLIRAKQSVTDFSNAEKEAAAGIGRAQSDAAQAQLDHLAEELAVFGKTNAQKVLIYKQMAASIEQVDAASRARANRLSDAGDAAWIASLQDMKKAHDKWVADMEKTTAGLIDDIVIKHKSLRDELKTIYDDILKNYISMVAKQLVASPAFGNIASSFGFGAPASPGTQSTYTNGALNVHVQNAGPDYLYSTTGSTTGIPGLTGGGGGSAGGIGSLGAGGGGVAGIGAALSLVLGSSAVGGGIGQTVAGGPGVAGGLVGGLAGGALAATGLTGGALLTGGLGALAALTPVGWGIIAASVLGGAVAGGAFGPHWGPASNYPDRSDTANYGQFVANIQGQPGSFNGTTINPQNQYYTANGGTSLSTDIENSIKQPITSFSKALQPLVTQLQGLDGNTPGGLGIASEYQGVFTLKSGKQISVTDYENLITQYQSLNGPGSTGSPIFSIGRSYPDFNQTTLTQNGSSAAGTATATVGGVTVNITNPTIVGASGLNDTAVAIATAIQRTGTGTIVGSGSTYGGTQRSLIGGSRSLA